MLCDVLLNGIILGDILLSVIMINANMKNVVAPFKNYDHSSFFPTNILSFSEIQKFWPKIYEKKILERKICVFLRRSFIETMITYE
jgi:hypothetical protein